MLGNARLNSTIISSIIEQSWKKQCYPPSKTCTTAPERTMTTTQSGAIKDSTRTLQLCLNPQKKIITLTGLPASTAHQVLLVTVMSCRFRKQLAYLDKKEPNAVQKS